MAAELLHLGNRAPAEAVSVTFVGSGAAAFREGVEGIGREAAGSIAGAGRPADLNLIHTLGGAEAEIDARVAVRGVAGTGAHLGGLSVSGGRDRDAGVTAVPVALR